MTAFPGGLHRKPHPEPLAFEREVSFAGVAGRETVGKSIRLENTTGDERMFWSEIVGHSFAIDSDGFGWLGAASSAEQTGDIAVRFAPGAAGEFRATLAITSKTVDAEHHFLDARESHQELALVGKATALEAPQTLAVAGGPEPVHALPDAKVGARDAHRRERQALESVSSLATTFNQIVLPGDRARDEFARVIVREGSALDARLIEWCAAEGIFEMSAGVKRDGLDDLATSMLMKVVDFAGEKAEIASPVMSAASYVIEMGLVVHGANKKNDEEKERQQHFGEKMEVVGKRAAATARSSTEMLVRHFGGLMNDYGGARATLAGIAVQGETHTLSAETKRALHSTFAQEDYDSAREIGSRFGSAMRRYADALRAIAGAASTVRDLLDRGFDTMRDRYLRARAGEHESQVSRSAPKLQLAADWDLGDPAYDRKAAITLNGARFGEYAEMSPQMRSYATGKSLSDFLDMDVSLRLRCVQDDEEIVIERLTNQEPRFVERSRAEPRTPLSRSERAASSRWSEDPLSLLAR